ncbi:MAG: Gfo/Idh/MocA family oxidoreductase [Acidobacteriota bacterium]|nr:Gfo/Idh/MocA family oxidoreductase [Acidobacteriota bacterium]
MDRVRVGIIGSGFSSNLHAEALAGVAGAEITAVCSSSKEHAAEFARKWKIGYSTADYRELLGRKDVDAVAVGIPNDLHREVVVAAAEAGKHVILEKPIAHTLADARRMVEACKQRQVKLMYAETIVFSPKYVRARQLAEENAIGRVYMAKQSEKHSGPHSEWFYKVERSGGGAIMDMGCHGIEWARWMFGKPKPKSVVAHCQRVLHTKRTRGEDNSVVILEFENGAIAVIENSWARQGGMDDRMELYGTEGVILCDLLRGSSMETYSAKGYGYAVEKAGSTQGWTFTVAEEPYLYGFHHEFRHFIRCLQNNEAPQETGEDGLATLEIIYAAYESAGTGRRVTWPYAPKRPDEVPVNQWLDSTFAPK